MLFGSRAKSTLPTRDEALAGRDHRPYPVPTTHEVLGTPLEGPWPDGTEVLYVAMGCFWGVERVFWTIDGVYATAVGYAGGFTENPTYEETCSGTTGHTEAVLVVFDPDVVSYEALLKAFWENHDPTQENRQGNDVGTAVPHRGLGTTKRSGPRRWRRPEIAFQAVLDAAGRAHQRREVAEQAGEFYYAEDYHQQYLHKNPGGYCNHGPNGLTCPVGVANLPAQTDIAPPA